MKATPFEITIYHRGIKRSMKAFKIQPAFPDLPYFRVIGKTGPRDLTKLGRTWFQLAGEDLGHDMVQQLGYAIDKAGKEGLYQNEHWSQGN